MNAELHQQYRVMFENMAQGAFYQLADGSLVDVNPAALEMFGLTREQFMGRTSYDAAWRVIKEDGADLSPDQHPSMVALRTGRQVRDVVAGVFNPAKNTDVWMTINAIPMFWEGDSSPYQVFVTLHDITERKQAEDEVRRLNADLHQLIAERTTELTQTNRDLSSFCYAISHELRAPVARLKGLSQALRDDFAEDPATAAHCAERIVVASDQLQQVIDSVLQLTRLAHVSFTLQPINVSGLAREIVDELLIDAPERRVEVVIADGLAASADLPLVRLCLANLIGNALKYSTGQPLARIEIGRDDASGALFVRDNGVGFDMAHADKIFEPFVRLHSEAEFAGTGIGLATVQRIIERHGGRIWAEAAPGVGATFFFALGPVRESPA